MQRKITAATLSAALALAAFAGCSAATGGADTSSGGSSAASGSITYVGGRDTTGAVKKIIADFESANPGITVNFQELPGNSDDIRKSIVTSLSAGDGSPDVFASDIIWISQFAASGWLLDVSKEMNTIKDQYLKGPVLTTQYKNKYYAFPYYTDAGLLYYRSDLVKDPPKTWDQLVSLSKEHIGKDGIEYGYVFQAFQGEPVVCNSLEFIKQNGGQDYVNGKFVLNSKNAVDALKFERSLIDDKISPEGVLTHKPDDTRAIFEQGKALFMRNWTYAYATSQASTSKVVGKVGVTTLPVGPSGKSSSGTVGGWNIAVNKNSTNKAAALKFAEYVSSAAGQKTATILASTFPTIKSVYDDADVNKAIPYLKDLQSAIDQAQPRPQVNNYSSVSTILAGYLHKALTKDEDYAAALEEADKALNAANVQPASGTAASSAAASASK